MFQIVEGMARQLWVEEAESLKFSYRNILFFRRNLL